MVDFLKGPNWAKLNEKISKDLGFEEPEKGGVRVYQGVSHGIKEVTLGLIKQLPHKKNVLYFKNSNPFFENVLAELSKQGCKLVALDWGLLESQNGILEKVDRETLVLLLPVDDPFLGRCFEFSHLIAGLNKKRAFSLSVSHHSHRGASPKVERSRYELELCSVSENISLLFYGSRGSILPVVAEDLDWRHIEQDKIQEIFQAPLTRLHEKVTGFEVGEFGGSKAYFSGERAGLPRTWDRAVVFWEDMDGYAFIDELSRELGRELGDPGQDDLMETASLSRWGGVKTMDWLKSYGLGPEQIRGLVILNPSLLNGEFPRVIEKVRATVLKKQLG